MNIPKYFFLMIFGDSITLFTLKLCYLYTIYILSKSQNGMVLCNFFTFLDRTPPLDALSISSKFKNILIHFFSGPTQNSEEIIKIGKTFSQASKLYITYYRYYKYLLYTLAATIDCSWVFFYSLKGRLLQQICSIDLTTQRKYFGKFYQKFMEVI